MIETFTFPLPPGMNEIVNISKKHWSAYSKLKKQQSNQAMLCCTGKHKFPDKVWIECWWYPDSFANDPDNLAAGLKFILDGMVKAGIIKNDNLTIIQSPVVHFYERGNKEVIIKVSDQPLFEEV